MLAAIAVTIVILLLSVVSVILYQSVKTFSREQSEQYNMMKFNQMYNKINADLAFAKQIGLRLRNNEEITGYLNQYQSPTSDYASKQLVNSKITNLLLTYKSFSPLIRNISVVSDTNKFSSDVQYLFNASIPHLNGQTAEEDIGYAETDGSLFLYSKMSDKMSYSCIIQLESDYFAELVKKHDYLMLFNPGGEFIRSGEAFRDITAARSAFEIDMNGLSDEIAYSYQRNTKVYVKPLDFFHWRMAYMEQKIAMSDHLRELKRISVMIFIIAAILSVAVAKPISAKVTGPLGVLIRSINRYEPIADGKKREMPLSSHSLIKGLTVYFVISIFLPIAVYLALFYGQSYKKINNELMNGYLAYFDEAVDHLDRYLNQKELIASSIASKRGVQDILLQQESAGKWNEYLKEYVQLGLAHDHLTIYDSNRNKLFSNLPLSQDLPLLEGQDTYIRNGKNEIKWRYDSQSSELQLTKEIRDVYSREVEMRIIGLLRIGIDKQDLWQQFEGFKAYLYNETFLLDPDDRSSVNGKIEALQKLVSGDSFAVQGSKALVGEIGETKYLFFIKKLDTIPLFAVSKYRYADIYKKNNFLINNMVFVTVITFLVTLIVSFSLSLKLINPLTKLNKRIKEIQMLGDLPFETANRYFIDEIDVLLKSFTDMTQRIEHLFDELLVSGMKNNRLLNEKNKAEISALQAQIKPHFLYNTLETINGLILEERKEDAMTMINCLSDLFRLSVGNRELQGMLKEELQHAKAYAAIMSIRYSNKLSFEWDIEEEILQHQVMMFILQPLIENAIYHGIHMKPGIGVIRISCKEMAGELLFCVEDNGIGIEAARLRDIRSRLASQHQGEQSGFGLYSVNLRLMLYYGEGYGLQVDSIHNAGTKVTYTIPAGRQGS